MKHSGVRQFDVQWQGTSEEVHLAVSDYGVGSNLKAARKSHGLGLNRMQERLKLVKGSLSIDSQPKRGTHRRWRSSQLGKRFPAFISASTVADRSFER
jgi:signal transduction histidine kinase